MCLVRPDGYVSYRTAAVDIDRLLDHPTDDAAQVSPQAIDTDSPAITSLAAGVAAP